MCIVDSVRRASREKCFGEKIVQVIERERKGYKLDAPSVFIVKYTEFPGYPDRTARRFVMTTSPSPSLLPSSSLPFLLKTRTPTPAMPSPVIQDWLKRVLVPYPAAADLAREVGDAVDRFPTLQVRTEAYSEYCFQEGVPEEIGSGEGFSMMGGGCEAASFFLLEFRRGTLSLFKEIYSRD
jgi:hypothetical protein